MRTREEMRALADVPATNTYSPVSAYPHVEHLLLGILETLLDIRELLAAQGGKS